MKNVGKYFFGTALVLVGVFFLLREFVPNLQIFLSWSWVILGLGGLGLLFALINHNGNWAVSSCVVLGVGACISLQQMVGGIIWIAMIAFLGLGQIIASWVDKNSAQDWRNGLTLILVAVVLFMAMGGNKLIPWLGFSSWWPVVLIVAGVLFLINTTRKK